MPIQTPNLTTANTAPLYQLERDLLQQQPAIECWLRRQWRETPPPFYASVDLRNAGFKLAPVDTNLFPGGFNNLNPDFMPLGVQAAQTVLEQRYPGCRRILLIPESHTRNQFYLHNVDSLKTLLTTAGYEVDVKTLEAVARMGNRLENSCLILLNNDLSSGVPAVLEGIEQPIIPALQLGWFNRTKTQHFSHYQRVCAEFGQLIGIDPWLIDPLFAHCEGIDFMQRQGESALADSVDGLLRAIRAKYTEYRITQKPFVVIKADAGTYGMGVMMVHDAAQVTQLNRKQRARMMASKGNPITRVIVQEGVYTFETWGNTGAVAEPVVYMIGPYVIGGFYRVHKERGINENLNAPGMHFEPLAFQKPCNHPDHTLEPDCPQNRFYAYGVIARLALVAAAREALGMSHQS